MRHGTCNVYVENREEKNNTIVSMMVMCNGIVIVIIDYGRRRSGLPSALLDMEYGNSNTEQSTAIILNTNMDIQSS